MKLLFLSHDATRTGAPIVLLHLLRWFKKQHPTLELHILLGKGGILEEAFAELGTIYHWQYKRALWNQITRGLSQLMPQVNWIGWKESILKWRLRRKQFDLVYGNTVLTAPTINRLKLDLPNILHIHELDYVVNHYGSAEELVKALPKVDKVIAVSDLGYKFLQEQFNVPSEKLELVYSFSDKQTGETSNAAFSLSSIPQDAFLVGACGTIDWRKGTDLFMQVAQKTISFLPDAPICFLWLGGNLEQKMHYQIAQDVRKLGLSERVLFVGSQPNPHDYFEQFDLFLMTSREDPFPLVCLENAQIGNPIICFEGATGSEIYIDDTTGSVVPYMDTQAMADAVVHFYQNPNLLKAAANKIKQAVSKYTIENSGTQIWNLIQELTSKTV